MRRVRFRDPAGAVRTGEWTTDGLRFAGETYDPDGDRVTVLPPCDPSKVVCVGRNYADHAAELDSEVPDRPLLFLKPPNAVTGPGATVPLPAGKRVDHEAELAVVVGEQARDLDPGSAMDAVAGFTAANDLSNRDDQDRETNWVRGKAFDGACPLGPVLADPADVPADASVVCRVNGERRQAGSRDQFVFDVPELLAVITAYLTLEPGDVVLTGTPAGVGALADGDRVAVEVEGVGTLEHTVARD